LKKKLIQSFNLEKRGINRVLGDLETEIMEVAWSRGEGVMIKEVTESISLKRPIAFNTVMTVMNRLSDKGFLQKKPGEKAYCYLPVQTKECFLNDISRQVTEELLHEYGEDAIASFVQTLEKASPEYLKALEDLIKNSKDMKNDDTFKE